MTVLHKFLTLLRNRTFITISIIILVLLVAGVVALAAINSSRQSTPSTATQTSTPKPTRPAQPSKPGNPISDYKFYVDPSRQPNKLAAEYAAKGDMANAELMRIIADNPGTTWLTGPYDDDKTAGRDIAAVERTSGEAEAQGTVPVYQLYALPHRDACADYSKGGFNSPAEYLDWIDRILGALRTPAVVSVEADSIAHTIKTNCLSPAELNERYALLSQTMQKLGSSPKVLAAYLDAGHSDWLPDPTVLVEPLKKAGVDHGRGIAVNVSFFAETPAVTAWAQQLVSLLDGNKGVIIDTSRNGKGIAQATGDARWCNPSGRGVGAKPTTVVPDPSIDAYFWGKNIGESDGTCFGNAPAGTFVPALALELARNAAR